MREPPACLTALAALALVVLVSDFARAESPPPARVSDRQHHYVFAHRVMPRLFYRDADRLMTAMAERRAELLRAMWVDLGEQFFSTAQVAADGIDVFVPAPAPGPRVVVLVFPRPVAPAEAFFAALVEMPGGGLSYFTLEKPFDPLGEGVPETMLGGWDQEGTHLNFGPGPKPIPEDFVAAVRRLVAPPARAAEAGGEQPPA
jgi:hypothetical protein